MIKVLPPPTEAEEYRNAAEILRDLAAQTRFCKTRNELFNCADNLERLAVLADHRPEAMVQTVGWGVNGHRPPPVADDEECVRSSVIGTEVRDLSSSGGGSSPEAPGGSDDAPAERTS
jgi:hypothetical protein